MYLAIPRMPAAPAAIVTASAIAVLATLNLAAPGGHTLSLVSAYGAEAVRGGLNWIGIIDWSCGITDVGALFLKANPYALAFCAGWGIGRLVGDS